MKVILGGGLVALLARDILGPDWTIVPVGKSRYYTFNPPLTDNYVVVDPSIDDYMRQFAVIPILHRVGYSYSGQILFNTALPLSRWLTKVYGGNVPPHANAFWKNRIDFFGMGNCIDMYATLQAKYKDEILANHEKYGKPTKIAEHTITTATGVKFDYTKILSTVPFPVLSEWMDLGIAVPGRDEYFYHIATDQLNFEGATTLHVVDPEIDFYKVRQLNKTNFIFHSCTKIEYPGRYLMTWLPKFELVAETVIEKSICCGPDMHDIQELKDADVACMGSHAAWDDCLDIGSCIKRLIKMRA